VKRIIFFVWKNLVAKFKKNATDFFSNPQPIVDFICNQHKMALSEKVTGVQNKKASNNLL
jgi:hypothetical protein